MEARYLTLIEDLGAVDKIKCDQYGVKLTNKRPKLDILIFPNPISLSGPKVINVKTTNDQLKNCQVSFTVVDTSGRLFSMAGINYSLTEMSGTQIQLPQNLNMPGVYYLVPTDAQCGDQKVELGRSRGIPFVVQ